MPSADKHIAAFARHVSTAKLNKASPNRDKKYSEVLDGVYIEPDGTAFVHSSHVLLSVPVPGGAEKRRFIPLKDAVSAAKKDADLEISPNEIRINGEIVQQEDHVFNFNALKAIPESCNGESFVVDLAVLKSVIDALCEAKNLAQDKDTTRVKLSVDNKRVIRVDTTIAGTPVCGAFILDRAPLNSEDKLSDNTVEDFGKSQSRIVR
jgi:hypothetical protein